VSQFGFLDTMQKQIDAAGWPVPVRILGVNAAGEEDGNAYACNGRDIPWLQDTSAENAWGRWAVTWRDVVILDEQNEPIGVYNLTAHSLADSTSYAELMGILRRAAGGGTAP